MKIICNVLKKEKCPRWVLSFNESRPQTLFFPHRHGQVKRNKIACHRTSGKTKRLVAHGRLFCKIHTCSSEQSNNDQFFCDIPRSFARNPTTWLSHLLYIRVGMQLCMKIMLRGGGKCLPILTPNTIYRSELTIFRFEITFVSPLSPASPNGIVQFNTTIKYESLMTGDGISFACGLENSYSITWALKPVRVFIPGTRMFEALVALLSLYLFLLQFPGKLSVALACYFSNTSHFISAHAGASCLPHLVRLFVIFVISSLLKKSCFCD